MSGGAQEGIAYLLRTIARLRHQLVLAQNEISRQRARNDLLTKRLKHAREKGRTR